MFVSDGNFSNYMHTCLCSIQMLLESILSLLPYRFSFLSFFPLCILSVSFFFTFFSLSEKYFAHTWSVAGHNSFLLMA